MQSALAMELATVATKGDIAADGLGAMPGSVGAAAGLLLSVGMVTASAFSAVTALVGSIAGTNPTCRDGYTHPTAVFTLNMPLSVNNNM